MATRDFTDFSMDEIEKIANEAGKKAEQESLDAGLEVISKDLNTGKFLGTKKNESGEIITRELTAEEVEKIRNG